MSTFPSPPPTLSETPWARRSRFSQFATRSLRPGARTNAVAISLVLGAASAGYAIPEPFPRAGVLALLAVLALVVGLYQTPPR